MTTTRRGNVGVARAPRPRNNSRIAKRYATPASVNEAKKYGPPRSPKLREQTVKAAHNVTPSTYTRCAGVVFSSAITILPDPSESGFEDLPETARPQPPTP